MDTPSSLHIRDKRDGCYRSSLANIKRPRPQGISSGRTTNDNGQVDHGSITVATFPIGQNIKAKTVIPMAGPRSTRVVLSRQSRTI